MQDFIAEHIGSVQEVDIQLFPISRRIGWFFGGRLCRRVGRGFCRFGSGGFLRRFCRAGVGEIFLAQADVVAVDLFEGIGLGHAVVVELLGEDRLGTVGGFDVDLAHVFIIGIALVIGHLVDRIGAGDDPRVIVILELDSIVGRVAQRGIDRDRLRRRQVVILRFLQLLGADGFAADEEDHAQNDGDHENERDDRDDQRLLLAVIRLFIALTRAALGAVAARTSRRNRFVFGDRVVIRQGVVSRIDRRAALGTESRVVVQLSRTVRTFHRLPSLVSGQWLVVSG